MSLVTKDEIHSLSRLARLELKEAEVETLVDDLSGILEHMAQLAEVDTTGVAPMTHVSTQVAALRPDVVEPSLDKDLVLSSSQRSEDDCFAVPSILPSGDKQ